MMSASTSSSCNLPSTCDLLTRLLQQLSILRPASSYSRLADTDREPDASCRNLLDRLGADNTDDMHLRNTLPLESRTLILTLHCLLPHVFVPALDLLDRGLVVRYIPEYTVERQKRHRHVPADRSMTNIEECKDVEADREETGTMSNSDWLYYVKSGDKGIPYETRTDVWHCTCANFTFYAFPSSSPSSLSSVYSEATTNGNRSQEGRSWSWGGDNLILSSCTTSAIPICKHLLAAVLSEQCPSLFNCYVREKRVSVDELAELSIWW